MSANTLWKVRVRKSYIEDIEVSAITEDEAWEKAEATKDVMFVEEVEWLDPYEKEYKE